MKRNLIKEITAIKSRSEFYSRHDYSTRLNDIERALSENLDYNGSFDKEIIKYIPIATIACFEAFFRSIYKELIDFGKPFSENAVNFNQSKNIKFDFEIVNAIQTKTVTVGEFISHLLPCSSFEDINSNLSILIGDDFIGELKKYKKTSINDDEFYSKSEKSIENWDLIIADIKRTFELRHIFCHEFATNLPINKDEIIRCFGSSKDFLNQVNNVLWVLMYPDAPDSEADIDAYAYSTFMETEDKLIRLLDEIKKALATNKYTEFNNDLFSVMHSAWENYRAEKAKFDAFEFDGGSMYGVLHSNSLTATTEEKIESLEKDFEIDLRRYRGI